MTNRYIIYGLTLISSFTIYWLFGTMMTVAAGVESLPIISFLTSVLQWDRDVQVGQNISLRYIFLPSYSPHCININVMRKALKKDTAMKTKTIILLTILIGTSICTFAQQKKTTPTKEETQQWISEKIRQYSYESNEGDVIHTYGISFKDDNLFIEQNTTLVFSQGTQKLRAIKRVPIKLIESFSFKRTITNERPTPGLVNGGVKCTYKVLSSLQRLPTVDSDVKVGLSIPGCSIAKASYTRHCPNPNVVANFIMTDRPTYPIILTDDSTGYLDLVDNGDSLTNSNALGLIKGVHRNFQAYDKDGLLWRIESVNSNYKVNGLTKLLAYTIYNPQIKVTLTWTKISDYKLDDLKNDIFKQTDRDDDIITQFEEGEVINEKIKKCDSFDDIIKTLNKYVFKVDEEELWKEQESRK